MHGLSGNSSEKRFVILTKIESDDMYRKDVVEEIQHQLAKERSAFVCDEGYVLSHEKPPIVRRIKWEIGKLYTRICQRGDIDNNN